MSTLSKSYDLKLYVKKIYDLNKRIKTMILIYKKEI